MHLVSWDAPRGGEGGLLWGVAPNMQALQAAGRVTRGGRECVAAVLGAVATRLDTPPPPVASTAVTAQQTTSWIGMQVCQQERDAHPDRALLNTT